MFCNLEERLAFHCGPALTGIKPSNIMSFKSEDYKRISEDLHNIEKSLIHRGIYFEVLFESQSHILIMVYQKKALEKCLKCEIGKSILSQQGYPDCENVYDYLFYLKKRILESNGEFPHEIGVFLGYPIEDVLGFIQHKGKSFKLNGYWKVYGDEKKASSMFQKYNECRSRLCNQIALGNTIQNVLGIA